MSWTVPLLLVESLGFANAQVIRSNLLNFGGARAVKWQESGHVVTKGQPYNGVTSGRDSSLIFSAGRQGSELAAEAFNSGLQVGSNGNAHVLGLEAAADGRPEKLNFMSYGALTTQLDPGFEPQNPSDVTRTCEEMRIGQGHRGATTNNWWIGGKDCFKDGHSFVCSTCGLSLTPGRRANEFVVHALPTSAVARAEAGGSAWPQSITVAGFQGCSFFRKACAAAQEMKKANPALKVNIRPFGAPDFKEFAKGRDEYREWLFGPNGRAKLGPAAAEHTTSPIVWREDKKFIGSEKTFIGGCDQLLGLGSVLMEETPWWWDVVPNPFQSFPTSSDESVTV